MSTNEVREICGSPMSGNADIAVCQSAGPLLTGDAYVSQPPQVRWAIVM